MHAKTSMDDENRVENHSRIIRESALELILGIERDSA